MTSAHATAREVVQRVVLAVCQTCRTHTRHKGTCDGADARLWNLATDPSCLSPMPAPSAARRELERLLAIDRAVRRGEVTA